MKLFVWEGVLTDYTAGMIVAVAPTVNEARKAIKKEIDCIPDDDLNEEPEEVDMTKPAVFWVWGGG